MTFPSTSAEDFRSHLYALGVRDGDHLTVHARLISFGLIEGGVATVVKVLSEAVGPHGTIIVPAYTLSPGTLYDRQLTPSEGVGALPEHVRARAGVLRSRCPMHNHAGFGARADVLLVSDGRVSFGPGSDFAVFLDSGFRLLLLGVSITEGATFVHHVEAMAGVPYRVWLDLPRQYVGDDGTTAVMLCRYYGRPNPKAIAENFDILEPSLIGAGAMTKVATHFGDSRLVSLRELYQSGREVLRADPYGLVTTK